MTTKWGNAAEIGARDIAASLGVQDFVYDPVEIKKGSATREVSDGLLIVGGRGIVLQVKARDPDAFDTPAKVEKWVRKQATEAVVQVIGTRRTLKSSAVALKSRRGHELLLQPGTSFAGVVLLDVANPPAGIGGLSTDDRTIVMTLEDWRTLNDMIRSISGVIDYVERVIESKVTIDLGTERFRYQAFAAADAQVTKTAGFAFLPPASVQGRERVYVELVDEWIDSDLAATSMTPDQTRFAVEMLDSIPLLGRVQLGESLLRHATRAKDSLKPSTGRYLMSPFNGNRIVFHCDIGENWESDSTKRDIEPWLAAFAAVRHEQFETVYGSGSTLLLSRIAHKTHGVARTFALITGDPKDLELPSEIRWDMVNRFGIATKDGCRDVRDYGRNECCPCGSGSKYKKCHLESSRT
jgi:SEC-C motif